MNVVSTLTPRYTQALALTSTGRRAPGVVRTPRLRNGVPKKNLIPPLPAQQADTLQGEIVDHDRRRTGSLRVRGAIFEGRAYRASDAILAYQLHQTISPATVSTPGQLLSALA